MSAPCGEATARRLTEGIRQSAATTVSLVIEAHKRRVCVSLGDAGWTEYVQVELNADQLKLPTSDRKRAAMLLADAGMSAREIGPVLGVGHATVSRDLSVAVSIETAAEVIEADGMAERPTGSRKPLPDAFRSAVRQLEKAAAKLERLTADDRFVQHVPELTDCRDDLQHAQAGLTVALRALDGVA